MWARIKFKFPSTLTEREHLVGATVPLMSKDAPTTLHATTMQKRLLTMLLVRSQHLPMWIAMATAWWPLTVRVSAVVLPFWMNATCVAETALPLATATVMATNSTL